MNLQYAITGANGQVGSRLVHFLRKQGHIVFELVRSPEKAKNPKYYRFFDLSQPDKIPSLCDIDVLIHSAYFFDTSSKDYQKINIAGTERLFQQAKQDEVNYSIFISTISAYKQAISLYGRTKFYLEQLLKAINHKICVVRPGLIFHPPFQGITAAMDRFITRYPIVPLIGMGKQLIYPCFLDDLSKLLFKLSIEQPLICNPIVAATSHSITFKQLVNYLAKNRNKTVFMLPIPFYGIYYALKMAEKLRFNIGLRSDSLLGLQYANRFLDFSETEKLAVEFKSL